MLATQTANPPTFESVWATLDRITEKQEENARQLKETDRILKEKALDFDKRIGALTNLFGDVTEAMIAPKICEKFEEFGFNFPRANPNVRFNDRVNKISFEVDIMLENGDKAMLIEAKTKLTIERINYHLSRLEKMRNYANLHGDKRAFLGAVAGIVVTDEVKDYALNQGFYFIEYAGENFYITPPLGKPKEW
jgi:ribosomal protein L9